MGFSKASAIAIKKDYNAGTDCTNEERYKTTNQSIYSKPKLDIVGYGSISVSLNNNQISEFRNNEIISQLYNVINLYYFYF